MSIKENIKKEEKEEVVLTSVEINKDLKTELTAALEKDGFTLRQIVEAGIKSYLQERKNENQ